MSNALSALGAVFSSSCVMEHKARREGFSTRPSTSDQTPFVDDSTITAEQKSTTNALFHMIDDSLDSKSTPFDFELISAGSLTPSLANTSGDDVCEALLRGRYLGKEIYIVGEGPNPEIALFEAVRKCLIEQYPFLSQYKVLQSYVSSSFKTNVDGTQQRFSTVSFLIEIDDRQFVISGSNPSLGHAISDAIQQSLRDLKDNGTK